MSFNKTHACILCMYSKSFEKPISMLTGVSLCLSFTCTNCNYPGSYDGLHSGKEDYRCMIYDLMSNKCWVDGCCDIPIRGCFNYKRSDTVNEEVENSLVYEK